MSRDAMRQDVIHELYRDHHSWLVRLLRRKAGCAGHADDLAQDTFVRILGKPDLERIRQARAYLATIAHGVVVDHIRRSELERAWAETLAALPRDTVPSVEDQAIVLETLAQIAVLLDGLHVRARRAFLLHRLEGLSYAQIASELGVSVSSVEKYMMAALRHCCRAAGLLGR
ncbi:sigma-70 family RNA polymerase sigma factor [Alcaligenaceae bacterium SJ-26]|nr:sigma-70 family RNA polymerase sigma factor [Alcaligenaceae bacterium SJ-26]